MLPGALPPAIRSPYGAAQVTERGYPVRDASKRLRVRRYCPASAHMEQLN